VEGIVSNIRKHIGRPKGSKNKAKPPLTTCIVRSDDAKRPKGWLPGQSGNPKGRPPKEFSITAQLEEALKVKTDTGQTKLQVLAERIVDKAISITNPQLVKLVLDRIDGPLKEQATVSNTVSFIKVVHLDTSGRIVESARSISLPCIDIDTTIDTTIDIDSIPTLAPPPAAPRSEGQALPAETAPILNMPQHNFLEKNEVKT
jgi:hypothetical protein